MQPYNPFEALRVGRLLDEPDYAWYDPVRTVDLDGLSELNRALNLPLHIGEFLFSISEFAEYIHKGALNVARLIADNVGGISGSMRVGLRQTPSASSAHPTIGATFSTWPSTSIFNRPPNAHWFEMPHPAEYADRPYHRHKFRVEKDGHIPASTELGHGCPIDHDAFDKILVRIDR